MSLRAELGCAAACESTGDALVHLGAQDAVEAERAPLTECEIERVDACFVPIHVHLQDADRALGFYEFARRARISSFPGEVYQIPRVALTILQDQHIAYREATGAEVKDAHDQVRNPSAAVL